MGFRPIRMTSLEISVQSKYMTFGVPDKSEILKPKLLDEVRRILRFAHYSLRTDEATQILRDRRHGCETNSRQPHGETVASKAAVRICPATLT